jgi:signal transduction histidine kinase
MDTLFAPAERDSIGAINNAFDDLNRETPYETILNLVSGITFILNSRRQVMFANAAMLTSFGLSLSEVVGARPGEIVGCVHSGEMPGGCGTAEACRMCGAVNAVNEAFRTGEKAARECRILTRDSAGAPGGLDLLVTAVPAESRGGVKIALVTMEDISDAKRREVLERIFFHDIMNSLSSLQACVTLMRMEAGSRVEDNQYYSLLSSTTERLIDEVSRQREILTMEDGELLVRIEEVDASALVRDKIEQVEVADYAAGKRFAFRAEGPPAILSTDPALLLRVVGNMLKNALEAAEQGEEISVNVAKAGESIEISVHNPQCIPRESRLQIFQRSFSTKGRGRGIGTFSMKVLCEEYLRGSISFESEEASGTTFTVRLPRGPRS